MNSDYIDVQREAFSKEGRTTGRANTGQDAEEIAFQETLTAWDNKSARDRRILSPRRHFFHSGYDVGFGVAAAIIAAQTKVIEKLALAAKFSLSTPSFIRGRGELSAALELAKGRMSDE